jgi:hypothetical protein
MRFESGWYRMQIPGGAGCRSPVVRCDLCNQDPRLDRGFLYLDTFCTVDRANLPRSINSMNCPV